jgi:hypothetical protein
MKTKTFQTSKLVRFCRWSRAGYAVFCSLVCNVTIGTLAISVSDKTLQKTIGKSSFSNRLNNPDSTSPEKLKDQADTELAIQQIQEFTLFEKTYESAAACGYNTNFILNPTVEMSKSRFNRFLFLNSL